MGIDWSRSAAKWGIPQQDVLFAIQHAVYTSTRVKLNGGEVARPRRVFVGPQHSQTDRLIEVLVELRPSGFVVYHAMPLGSHYRQQMEQEDTS